MLTLPQARLLIATIFELRTLSLKKALEIVKYHTQRNYIAYVSHRKKQLAKLNSFKN